MTLGNLKAKMAHALNALNAAKAGLADLTAESEARLLHQQTQVSRCEGACQQIGVLIQEEEQAEASAVKKK